MASNAASLYSGGRDTRNALWGRKPVATWLKQPCPAQFAEVATAEIPSRADFMERPSLPAIWRFRQHGPPRQYGAPGGMAGGAPIHRFRAAPSRDNYAVGLRFNCQHVPPFTSFDSGTRRCTISLIIITLLGSAHVAGDMGHPPSRPPWKAHSPG